jgi:hypothetical protein
LFLIILIHLRFSSKQVPKVCRQTIKCKKREGRPGILGYSWMMVAHLLMMVASDTRLCSANHWRHQAWATCCLRYAHSSSKAYYKESQCTYWFHGMEWTDCVIICKWRCSIW